MNIILAVQSARMAASLQKMIEWKVPSVSKSLFYLFASLFTGALWSTVTVILEVFDERLLVWHLLTSAAIVIALGSLFNILRGD